MRIRAIILGGLLALLCGCEVGPNYKRPGVGLPKNYGELNAGASTQPSVTAAPANLAWWWTNFDDPELNSLVRRAIAGNLNYRQAQSRVRQARYEATAAAAGLWPTVNADGGYQHARGSKNVKIPTSLFGGGSQSKSGGAAAGGGGAAVAKPAVEDPPDPPQGSAEEGFAIPPPGPQSPLGNGGFPGATTDLYQAGFDASWEIDVFGGAQRGLEEAEALEEAAVEDQRDTLVTLLAEVARNYLELRGYQVQEAIARANLASQQETLELTRSKSINGFVTQLDVAQAAEELDTTEASLEPILAGERQCIDALAILLGEPPEKLSSELSAAGTIPAGPGNVPVGLPSDLLRRRPDIRRAERQLAAATAEVGVATADLFPKFNLTASAGLDATNADKLLNWDSRYYSLVPGVSWEIFDAGKVVANIGAQNEAQKQALEAYQNAVLNALKDVDDALAQYETEQVRHAALSDAVKNARAAVALAQDRYDRGVTDFLAVLDAQRTLLSDENSLAQSDLAVSEDLVAIYKALGGGWEDLGRK
jgi:multidrug efflux system outer membrane protein